MIQVIKMSVVLSMLLFSPAKEQMSHQGEAGNSRKEVVPFCATEDRLNKELMETINFAYSATAGIDVQYRVTNTNETMRYYFQPFNFKSSGNVVTNVPGLDPCPRVQMRAKRTYTNLPSIPLTWTVNRTTCSTVSGSMDVTLPPATSWNSIPWITLVGYACPCI